MTIRLLTFAGCPHLEPTEQLIRKVVALLGVDHRIETLVLDSDEDAVRQRALGSPTVQVDGVDIEPSARQRTSFGLSCRLYGSSGVPPAAMIEAAIREADV